MNPPSDLIADRPHTLTCATWNIHGCIGRDRRHDPERIRRVLRELDADLVALQEVEVLKQAPHLLEFLSANRDWSAITGPTLKRPDGHYGNAVITRLPILRQRKVDLSLEGREPRGAIELLTQAGNHRVRLVATHLGLRPGERRIQTLRLLELIRTPPPGPTPGLTVLAGDLNEWFLWGRPLRWFRNHFRSSPAPPSFPSGWPLLALDRIWVDPREQLLETRVWKSRLARTASDHLPVISTLRLPSQGTAPQPWLSSPRASRSQR